MACRKGRPGCLQPCRWSGLAASLCSGCCCQGRARAGGEQATKPAPGAVVGDARLSRSRRRASREDTPEAPDQRKTNAARHAPALRVLLRSASSCDSAPLVACRLARAFRTPAFPSHARCTTLASPCRVLPRHKRAHCKRNAATAHTELRGWPDPRLASPPRAREPPPALSPLACASDASSASSQRHRGLQLHLSPKSQIPKKHFFNFDFILFLISFWEFGPSLKYILQGSLLVAPLAVSAARRASP